LGNNCGKKPFWDGAADFSKQIKTKNDKRCGGIFCQNIRKLKKRFCRRVRQKRFFSAPLFSKNSIFYEPDLRVR
jgi:hypothetical protein